MTEIRPQSDFPYLEEFSKAFDVSERTVFAYDDVIYSDYNLPNHLVIHERTHHEQQKRDGLEVWVRRYLTEPYYRQRMEVEAYRHQISFVTDRNQKFLLRRECASTLSSSLYGNMTTYDEALKLLS